MEDFELLRKKWAENTMIPINVFDDKCFENRLLLFESTHSAKTKYEEFLSFLDKEFKGDINKCLSYINASSQRLRESIETTTGYQNFLKKDLSEYSEKNFADKTNFYIPDNTELKNNIYISIDLKKANYQALKFFDESIFSGCNTFEEFAKKTIPYDIIVSFKSLRERSLGKLDERKISLVENYLIYLINELIINSFDTIDKPVKIDKDELIYKIDVNKFNEIDTVNIEHLAEIIKKELGVDVRVLKYKFYMHQFSTPYSGKMINVFEKDYFCSNKKKTFHCVPLNYSAQIYRLLKNEAVNDYDLFTTIDNEIVRYDKPLIINQEIEDKIKKIKWEELPF